MSIEDRLRILETQQALRTESLRRIVQGNWEGAEGAVATVAALLAVDASSIAVRQLPSNAVRTRLMLDRAFPPSVGQAGQLARDFGVEVWGVYVGGPAALNVWSPTVVQAYSQLGMLFLPIYVGQQASGVLTAAQAAIDAADAVACMRSFGWLPGAPVCLDVEAGTFDSQPQASLTYTRAWVAALRAAGFRPGVYAAPRMLRMAPLVGAPPDERPDFVWAASHASTSLAPHLSLAHIKNLPDDIWTGPGQRAWQYAISVATQRVFLNGIEVDISLTSIATPGPSAA